MHKLDAEEKIADIDRNPRETHSRSSNLRGGKECEWQQNGDCNQVLIYRQFSPTIRKLQSVRYERDRMKSCASHHQAGQPATAMHNGTASCPREKHITREQHQDPGRRKHQ